MKKGTILAAALAVLCGGIAVFLALQLQTAHQTIETTQAALTQAQRETAALEAELAEARQDYEDLEAQLPWLQQRDNPIDQYYFSLPEHGRSTYEMSTDGAFYEEAWKRELDHAIAWTLEDCREYGDAEAAEALEPLLEQYRAAVEQQASLSSEVIWVQYERGMTGSIRAVVTPDIASDVYRQGTFVLLDSYWCSALDWRDYYPFGFTEETVREICQYLDSGDPVDEWLTELFPPIAEVIPTVP